jgi:hypothetical protein
MDQKSSSLLMYLPHPPFGMMYLALHRREGHAQHLCDLLVRQVFEVSHLKDSALNRLQNP